MKPNKLVLNNMYHGKKCTSYALPEELIMFFKDIPLNGKVIVDLSEGYCIHRTGLAKIITFVADLYNIPHKNITILNSNLLSDNTSFNAGRHSHSASFAQVLKETPEISKNIQRKFCIFVNNLTFHRLVLSSWFYSNARDTTFQSLNAKKKDILGDLLDLVYFDDEVVNDTLSLIKELPITIDTKFEERKWETLEKYYPQSFVEMVIETACDGTVFFPTEKIFRPIALLTPFIVFGPRNFLRNLQRSGYKTFSKWWPEHYDSLDGNHRVLEIVKILEYINSLSMKRLQEINKEMQPVLDYNRKVLLTTQISRLENDVDNSVQ